MEENFLLKKENLQPLFEAASKEREIFVPCLNENGVSTFLPYNKQALWIGGKTTHSPKKILRPPLEKEFFFRKKSSSFEVEHLLDKEKRLLFGVRPCDTHAIKAFDKLYLEYFTKDEFYAARRNDTLIFAMQCSEACENGFCQSMKTDKPTGHDILLVEKNEGFFVEIASPGGKEFVEKFRDFFNRTKFTKPESNFKCEKTLNTEGLKEILDANFQHEKWKTEGEKCLSCSSCTQVCPSCYCFLTFDTFILNTDDSERFRQWDSCQFKRFTKVAGNHVFRNSRESRLRQFVMHKLSYFQENQGMPLCVGCGRCITVCPVKIDLTEISETIRSDLK